VVGMVSTMVDAKVVSTNKSHTRDVPYEEMLGLRADFLGIVYSLMSSVW